MKQTKYLLKNPSQHGSAINAPELSLDVGEEKEVSPQRYQNALRRWGFLHGRVFEEELAEEEEAAREGSSTEESEDLSQLNIPDLVAIAKQRGVSSISRMNKAELVEALQAE